MTPNVDERLASVVRALTDVVLPALPAEAGLAQEQVQLALVQLQILRAQLDGSLAFEADELADAAAIGEQLAGMTDAPALAERLAAAKRAATPADIRAARMSIHAAIHDLIPIASRNPAMVHAIMRSEKARVVKDRAWFAPFGFDIAPPEA